jgi:putative nucleotidyltransferase with HDIG domain
VPLIVQDHVIGILVVGRKGSMDRRELGLLVAIADMAANALQRAALHEASQREIERLSVLHTIDTAIASSLDLRLTLNVLAQQICSQLHVHAADILLFRPHSLTLEYAAGHGFLSRVIEDTRLRLGEGLAGKAALERTAISVTAAEISDLDPTSRKLIEAHGFQAYFVLPLVAKGEIKGVLELFHRESLPNDDQWKDFLDAMATQAAIAIDNAELFDGLQRSNLELEMAYDATIEGWSQALDFRDRETEGHSQRVTELTVQLARAIGIPEKNINDIRRGALLHDIGKISVPDAILHKPGSLTDEEWGVMRRHPQLAYEMLLPINYLRAALDIPHSHHEKWDGTGYPRGLKGEQIPLPARIFAVVDVWDALTSDRPYRPAWSKQKALEYIQEQAGKHFDPMVVDLFLSVIAESGLI